MTPYAPNDPETGNVTAHELLGEAMRVFYANPVVPQNYLVDGLKAAREELRIIQNTLDLEELSRVWSTFTQPFRLSILYQISVVQIDLLAESERAMPKRCDRDVRAPPGTRLERDNRAACMADRHRRSPRHDRSLHDPSAQ